MGYPQSAFKDIAETHQKIFHRIDQLEGTIKENREKLGDGTSAELKQEVNKLSQDVATAAAKTSEMTQAVDEIKDSMEVMAKENQEMRKQRVEWTASQEQDATPAEEVFKHLYRKSADQSLRKIRSVEEVADAIPSYGEKSPHKSDFRGFLLPRSVTKEKFLKTIKALVTANSGSGSGAAGALLTPEYMDPVLSPAQEMRDLIDEFPSMSTDYEKVYWRQEVLATRRAAPGVTVQSLDFTGTGQGNSLGEMEMRFELKDTEMRTLGAFVNFAVQILQDVGYLQMYALDQLRYEAVTALIHEILYGITRQSGATTGTLDFPNLDNVSIDLNTDLLSDVVSGSVHYLDVLKAAWLQAALTFIPADKHFMHPTDHTAMMMLKDRDGRYMFVDNMPFGMPVAESTFIEQGDWFTAPTNHTCICVKRGWETGLFYENRSNIEELKVTMRIYGRYGFVILRPGSHVKGTFASAFNA